MIPRAARLAVAVPVAAAVAVLVRWALPEGLDLRTDIVGYPIHRNFDVYGLFRNYYAVLLVPVVAVAVDAGLGRWSRRRRPGQAVDRPPRPPVGDPAPDQEAWSAPKAAAGRLLFAGAVAGLAAALAVQPSEQFWLLVGFMALGYVVLVTVTGAALGRVAGRLEPVARRALVNAVALAGLPLLLYAVSASSEVTVLAGGQVRPEPWLPLWLAVAATAILLAAVARGLARAGSDGEVLLLERRAVLLVAGSVGLFLAIARLPGAVGGMDFFHDGEHLVGADLVGHGAFPWRDVLFVHGLVEDVVHAGLGFWVFGNDVWGGLAGLTVVLGPLYWVGLYLLSVHLFGRNWLFLVLTVALVLQGWLTPELNRLVLLPYLLLALAGLLRRATPARAACFVLLGLATSVATPESALAVLAGGITVVAFDAWYGPTGVGPGRRFRRTLWCAAASVVAVAVWFAYLAANGALGSFLFSYRAFLRDHELTGGFPVSGTGFDFWFAVVVPVGVAVGYLWWFGDRLARRRPTTTGDWVAASVAVFVLLYFRKFLSRADHHAFHVLAASLPLLYYALYRVVDGAESALRRTALGGRVTAATTRHPVSLALVVLLLALTPGPALGAAEDRIPHSWQVTVPDDLPRLGYSTATALPPKIEEDLGLVLATVLDPGDELFDMTNSTALFHYLLGVEPATRYYHVSMAIRRSTQRDLIEGLRRARPKLVVLDGGYGLPNWDLIPNTVRHYEVAEYVLRRYKPLVHARSFTFLLRADLAMPPLEGLAARMSEPPGTGDILAGSRPCEWGYAPEFLSDDRAVTAGAGVSLPFSVTPDGRGQAVTLTVPPGVALARFGRLEIETRRPLRADDFALSPPPAGNPYPITFKTTGQGTRRYRVRVGSCPQWYSYRQGPLLLHSGRPQDIVAVRLYR